MTHTIEPISGLIAFQEALGMLHTIMTGRSVPNVERTEAAKVLIDALLAYEAPAPSMQVLTIPVVRY